MSPSYSQRIRSRSPRLKESSEQSNRDRRLRRSPETNSDNKRKLPAASTHQPLRRRTDEISPPPRARSRDRKVVAKSEKSRDRLLEPGYLGRTRSPYRDPYTIRDASPTGSSYRERPYDSRRVYSPPPSKMERSKEDLYDARPRRPISPEVTSLRRPVSSRTKDYHDYEHDWPPNSESAKHNEWEHSDHRGISNFIQNYFMGFYCIPTKSFPLYSHHFPIKFLLTMYPDSLILSGNSGKFIFSRLKIAKQCLVLINNYHSLFLPQRDR